MLTLFSCKANKQQRLTLWLLASYLRMYECGLGILPSMTDAGRLATTYILLSARSDSLANRGMLFVCLIYYQNIRELTSFEIAIISFYVWVHHSTCTFRLFFNSLQVITIWSWRSCCKVPIFFIQLEISIWEVKWYVKHILQYVTTYICMLFVEYMERDVFAY